MMMTDYMDVSECTTGEWSVDENRPYHLASTTPDMRRLTVVSFGTPTGGSGWPSLNCTDNHTIKQCRANARLIADAGTTAHRTGKSPSQLADELEEANRFSDMLLDIVHHAWLHSSYRDCGRDQMDIAQKNVYDAAIQTTTNTSMIEATARERIAYLMELHADIKSARIKGTSDE